MHRLSRTGCWYAATFIVAATLLPAVLAHPDDQRASPGLQVVPISTPAPRGSAEPNVCSGPDGSLYVSWIRKDTTGGHSLWFAQLQDRTWSDPRLIASGANWFVNWADFPTMAVADSNTMLAGWLQKTGRGKYAYDVQLSLSRDAGETWSHPFPVHADTSATEHGFLSLAPLEGGQFAAVWLDGREMVGEEGPMTLRFTTVGRDGRVSPDTLLDGRVCDCCQTGMIVGSDGSINVVYRDRSDTEVRDISSIRRTSLTWSEPRAVHADNWKIAGCPVNGPAIARRDSLVAVAWFTMGSNDSGRVLVSFSKDNGRTFAKPMGIDEGDPIGRADVAFFEDGTAVAAWHESAGDSTHIAARRVASDGRIWPSIHLARTSAGRESGFPRMDSDGHTILIAWTNPGDTSQVLAALIRPE